jgi:phage shock protein A
MTNERPGLLHRFTHLVRGMFTVWIRRGERRNPAAVYEQAIEERTRQYRELKEAVAGILYMRNKLEAEITERRAEIARIHDDIRGAIRRGHDELSLTLIENKQVLMDDLERAERELCNTRQEAEEAKGNLLRFREEIRSLTREKGRVLATLANAHARRRLNEAVEGLSIDADMRALESVREHVARMATERQLDQELGGDDATRRRLRAIRADARHEAARRELEELKQSLQPRVAGGSRSAKASGATGSGEAGEVGVDFGPGRMVPLPTS